MEVWGGGLLHAQIKTGNKRTAPGRCGEQLKRQTANSRSSGARPQNLHSYSQDRRSRRNRIGFSFEKTLSKNF
jgi:hypothetical protein